MTTREAPASSTGRETTAVAQASGAGRWTPSVTDALSIERVGGGEGATTFVGPAHPGRGRRTFGGEVAGQAVLAAGSTTPPGRVPHSAHMHFLLPGDTSLPTQYLVETTRDGGAFSTRQVRAQQSGRTIFTAVIGFHRPESGLEHQAYELATGPDDAAAIEETFARHPENLAWARGLTLASSVDIRFRGIPSRAKATMGEKPGARQGAWLRSRTSVPDGPLEQAAALAYVSDLLLLSTVLGPHRRTLQDGDLQFATINHTVWFHAPLRVDEWFLYEQDSRWAGGARALAHGEIIDATGRLCATTTQEGLVRVL